MNTAGFGQVERSFGLYPDVYIPFLEYFTYAPAYHHIKNSEYQWADGARRYGLEYSIRPPEKVEMFGGEHIIYGV